MSDYHVTQPDGFINLFVVIQCSYISNKMVTSMKDMFSISRCLTSFTVNSSFKARTDEGRNCLALKLHSCRTTLGAGEADGACSSCSRLHYAEHAAAAPIKSRFIDFLPKQEAAMLQGHTSSTYIDSHTRRPPDSHSYLTKYAYMIALLAYVIAQCDA